MSVAIAKDKDGNTRLTSTNLTDYISVNTETHKVTLNSAILPATNNGDEVRIGDGTGEYSFYDNFKTPTYTSPTWSSLENDASTLSFTVDTGAAGYKLSTNGKTLSYIGSGTHDFLTVTGLKAEPDATVYDAINKTVTLPNTVLNNAQVKLTSENGDTDTLNLGTELDPVRTSAVNNSNVWVYSEGTLTSKSVTRDYYERDSTNSNVFNYKPQANEVEQFTITGLKITLAPDDTDGDTSYGEYLSFNSNTSKIKILDASILPKSDAPIAITGAYSFDIDTVEQPIYVGSNAKWGNLSEGTATLSITASKEGYEVSNGDKTLTYVDTEPAKVIATISGIPSTIDSGTDLDKGIEVDVDNKTLTLSASVLGESNIILSDSSEYTLALGDDVTQSQGSAQPVWEISGTNAYYRRIVPKYYTSEGNGAYIAYHAKEQSGSDLVAFSGLKASGITVNNDGDIVADGTTTPLVTVDGTTVLVNTEALADSGIEITGGNGYRFALNSEAIMTSDAWAYDSDKGEVTVTGTFGAGYLVSSDGQKIIKKAANGTEVLAKITGLKTGLTLDATATKALFDFDAVSKTITFKDDTLLKGMSEIKLSDDVDNNAETSNFFKYNLALADGINPTATTATKWIVNTENVTNADGTVTGKKVTGISYQNVTPARYTLSNNVIRVTPESATGSALATVTGLKELAAGQSWAEGTTAGAFSIVNDNGTAYPEGVDAVSVDSNKVITVKTIALPDTVEEGQTPAEVKVTVNNGYTLALDPTDQTISGTAEYSNYKWVQDATVAVEAAEAGESDSSEAAEDGEGDDGESETAEEETPETEPNHTAYIKADKTASYALNTAKNTITFTPGETQATIATIEGLSAVSENKNQDINTASTSELGNGAYVDVLEKTIYLKNAAMNGENITLTNSGVDFSLALYDEQNKVASDKWSYDEDNNAYKYASTTPAYYTRASAIKITYTDEAPSETPYFTISGLKDGLTIADNAVKSGATPVISIDQSTKTVTLKKAALPAYVPASTATETDSETGEETVVTTPAVEVNVAITGTNGYKLAFDENVDNKSAAGDKSYEINESTGDVTVSEAVTEGYALNPAGTAITYNDGTGSTPLFTITGLKIDETPTDQAGWDALFTVDGTTVTVNSAALGNSKVTISNDDYTLALGGDVTKESGATSSYDWVLDNEATKTYSYKLTKGFYYAIESNEIKYHDKTPSGTALVTVSGLTGPLGTEDINTTSKVITLNKNVVGTKDITIDGTSDYTLSLGDGANAVPTNEVSTGTWSVNGTTAKYQVTKTSAYKLSDDKKTVTAGAEDTDNYFEISGLKSGLTFDASNGNTKITLDDKTVTINDDGSDAADSVLTDTSITITGHGDYADVKLAFDAIGSTESTATAWSVSGTTASYKSTTSHTATYALDENKTTIKYTAAKTDPAKTLVNITGLKSGLKAESGAITGIAIDANNKITLSKGVLGTSTVKLDVKDTSELETGKEYGLVLNSTTGEDKVTQATDTTVDWEYKSQSGKDTFTYKNNAAYYELNEDSDTVKYVTPTNFVTISGTNFAESITGDDDAKVTAFKNFVDTSDAGKVIIKKANNNTLANGGTLTVTTAGDYTVELNSGDGVAAEGTSWAYDGNKLILESNLSAGYTLKETKANNYTLGTSGEQAAQKLATISGLDLASAKEAATTLELSALSDDEKSAAGITNVTDEDTADVQTKAKIANAKFNHYINDNIDVSDTGTITIKPALLGTSAVTIANNGDVDYKLDITSDTANGFYVGSDTAKNNASDLWTFSGGTATLKETTPEYYTLDTKTNKITYTAAKATATLATVKGLFSSKVVGTGELEDLATISQTIDGTKKTTVKTNTFYTDTTVVKVNDNNVIGAQTIRKTQVVTTTQTDTINADGAVTKVGKPATTKGAVEEGTLTAAEITALGYEGASATFAQGVAVVTTGTGADEVKKIKVNEKVLGTSTVTLTNGKDSSGAVQTYKLDYIKANDDDALTTATETLTAAVIPAVARGETNWTGSVNGTSTVLKADYSAGYELAGDGMKITYTAAKNNVSLATIGGIIIKFDDTAKAELEPTETELQIKLNAKIATAEATALEEKKAEYVAKKLTENLPEAEDGAVVSLTDDQKTELAALELTDDEKAEIAAATALTTAEINAIKTEKTAADVNTWVATHINYTSTDLDKKGATADDPIKFTITDDDVFNKKDITVTSNDKKNYAIALHSSLVTAQDEIATTASYAWNGTTYQESDHDIYYEQATVKSGDTTANDPKKIKYYAAAGVVNLATVKGLKSGVDLTATGVWTAGTGANAAGGTLNVDASMLGTSKVTLTPTAAATSLGGDFTFTLATTGENSVPTLAADYDGIDDGGEWLISGGNATLKGGGKKAYYTLDETTSTTKTISYHAESGTKTLATLKGLKADATAAAFSDATSEGVRTITLKQAALGTTNITLAKGSGDTLTYKLKLDASIDPSHIITTDEELEPNWATTGVNTTLKGAVTEGWELSANELTAVHTASATNKALATLVFDKAGITEGSATVVGKTVTLDNIRTIGEDPATAKTNSKITIKTNTDGLTFNITDANFKGTATTKVSAIGSASADGFTFANGRDNIIVSGAAGDDTINLGAQATNASISGGAGDDFIDFGTGSQSITLNGDAGNDIITGGIKEDSEAAIINKIYGGAGDDQLDISGDVDSATMLAGAGNDAITIGGAVTGATTINADAGNDEITIGGAVTGATILAGIGNDKITIGKDDTAENKKNLTGGRIVLDAGNDELYITGDIDNADSTSTSTILAGAGDDKITVGGNASYATILADAGNDTVSIGGAADHITINAAAGNDEIHIGSAEAISIFGGDGIDEINIGAVTDSTINAGAANDIINISDNLSGSAIFGDAGNDSMTFASVGASTINAGAGNDTITIADAEDVSVLGDAGDDVITFKEGSGTVFGGAGNDTVDLGSGAVDFYYISGNGNDYIKNFTEGTNKFVLKAGTIKSAAVGGINDADLILTIGSNKVTLEGAGIRTSNEFSYTSGVGEAAAKTVTIAGITASSSDLAEDISSLIYNDNNLMTPNDISDIVSTNSVTEYHVGNYNLTTPDQILPQSDAISYGDQQKKNK